MNGRELGGAVPLDQFKQVAPEVTVYPVAQVTVEEGGVQVGDSTHHLRILLPIQGKEIHIPFNARRLRDVGRTMMKAGGVPQPAHDDTRED